MFGPTGIIKKYENITEILEEFYNIRLTYYEKRKDYLISKLMRELEILMNKKRFILAVINEEFNIKNKKKSVLVEDL
jgi:DNA topoisomerase-2